MAVFRFSTPKCRFRYKIARPELYKLQEHKSRYTFTSETNNQYPCRKPILSPDRKLIVQIQRKPKNHHKKKDFKPPGREVFF